MISPETLNSMDIYADYKGKDFTVQIMVRTVDEKMFKIHRKRCKKVAAEITLLRYESVT